MTLVSAVVAMTSQTAPVLLEDFGEFLVPVLMKLHRQMLRPAWKTLDVIEHTECTMHRIVRIENHAHPPHLKAERRGTDEVLVTDTSPRRMCALAVGIEKGLATQFQEKILITQPVCIHKGGGPL
jgi:hypothetical protein